MKKVKMSLRGIDGNAFVILGTFRRKAKDQGWSDDEINAVTDEAKKSDYQHLVGTILDNIK